MGGDVAYGVVEEDQDGGITPAAGLESPGGPGAPATEMATRPGPSTRPERSTV